MDDNAFNSNHYLYNYTIRYYQGIKRQGRNVAGIGIPALVTIMPSVIYAFNPPALFGYITLDISLCDMTDNAFYMYLVTFCMCMTAAYILIYLVISGLLDMRKLAVYLL
ncbi:MAG: hypothetical protein ACLS9K_10175 [Lachnospira eligens]